jgi:aminoglycoside phosphotransferase (APT) family kinase protein
MARELVVLPLVQDLGLPVPDPRHVGVPALGYPWPFWGGPLVDGEELCRRPGVPRRALASSVGAFLRRLHTRGPAPTVDLPLDPMRRGDAAHRAALAREPLGRLDPGLTAPAYRLLEEASGLGPSSRRVLVHGDLHLRHVLVRDDGAAAGVIDWGDSCWADPAVDLSFGYAALTGGDREAFLDAYGGADPDTELRARVLAVNLCAVLAQHADDVGDGPLLAESLAGLGRASA